MLDKACDMISKREMPLWQYRVLHLDARLSGDQITALCAWAHAEADRLARECAAVPLFAALASHKVNLPYGLALAVLIVAHHFVDQD
jgi:hypothetical protein